MRMLDDAPMMMEMKVGTVNYSGYNRWGERHQKRKREIDLREKGTCWEGPAQDKKRKIKQPKKKNDYEQPPPPILAITKFATTVATKTRTTKKQVQKGQQQRR